MGIYIYSYAIRTENLKKAISSNDNHLYEDVSKAVDDEAVDTKSALKDLIFNLPLCNHSADSYLYAFEALCSYFGKELPYWGDFKLRHVTDTVDNIFKSDFGLDINIEETMINHQEFDFFELPNDQESVFIGVLYRDELLSLQSQFKKIQITDNLIKTLEYSLDDELEREIGYSMIKAIKEHISYCVEGGFDLVSFCY